MSKLTTLHNIGKVTAEKLEQIGIHTAEEFLERNPYDVFDELLEKVDPTLCKCALAGIVGAYHNTKWNFIQNEAVATFEKRHPKHVWNE
ncbi:MAG: TfoX/Sxy family DNA transformation protein [Candidatus Auribacterota bacterium]